jgi:hypothetical protein
MWDTANLTGKFIAVNAYILKKQRSQIPNGLPQSLRKSRTEQVNLKVSS